MSQSHTATTTTTATSSREIKNNNKVVGQNKKRRRSQHGNNNAKQAYYDRLLYQCHKELHKQAKLTRTHLVQKCIRKIKEETVQPKRLQMEEKLRQMKDFSLDRVIQECYRRLGILQLDPKLEFSFVDNVKTNETIHDDRTDTNKMDVSQPTAENLETKTVIPAATWILERLLQHKRMISALEHWNEQITEYRRWCLHQQERTEGIQHGIVKKDKKSVSQQYDDTNTIAASSNSVFLTLGADDNNDATNRGNGAGTARADDGNNKNNDTYYGPAGASTLKKNRQGQRARKAKVQAIEARKAGRTLRPEESLNWRAKKAFVKEYEHDSAPQKSLPTPENIESLHPSWQARKVQKEGIVEFKGKKITFD